jgi:hypothetical protein
MLSPAVVVIFMVIAHWITKDRRRMERIQREAIDAMIRHEEELHRARSRWRNRSAAPRRCPGDEIIEDIERQENA